VRRRTAHKVLLETCNRLAFVLGLLGPLCGFFEGVSNSTCLNVCEDSFLTGLLVHLRVVEGVF
jgi:hypothetical protein